MVTNLISKLDKSFNIHLVGECNLKSDRIKIHQFKHYREVLKLMIDTKAVVSTSTYDPAPNILYEASLMGCNVIASKNCGNWEICNQSLLVDDYCEENFIEKIHRSINKKYEDNMQIFLDTDVAEKLSLMLDEY